MAAERAWLSRWKGNSPTQLQTTDEITTLDALAEAWAPLRAEMLDFLTGIGDGRQEVIYRTTKGDEFHNILWHLVAHVINHSTEHRSQVALHLAMHGIDVGGLDFSKYVREAAGEQA
jgi:uncharacterized damage-inducible protein DinB